MLHTPSQVIIVALGATLALANTAAGLKCVVAVTGVPELMFKDVPNEGFSCIATR